MLVATILIASLFAPVLAGALLSGYRHDSNARYYMNIWFYCAYVVAFYLFAPLDYLVDDLRGGFE